MTVRDLAFDAETMLGGLRTWVECESPTYDAAAVNRMMDLAARDFALAGGLVERIPGRMGYGDCVRVRFPHPKMHEPGALFLCHLDTVHPVGTLAELPFARKGERCYGPAILDMKGGTYAALEAVKALRAEGVATPLPITFLLTSDEEAGTPSTRELVEAEGRRQRYALLPERCRPDGGVVTGRAGIVRFDLKVRGKPSHALSRAAEGSSAIKEMARRVIEIEAMSNADRTFAVGVINGGQWVNCVPIVCHAQAMVVARTQAHLDEGVAMMLALAGEHHGATFSVTRTTTRPLWNTTEASKAAYVMLDKAARAIGMTVGHAVGGGGSDGNIVGVLGVPTLDGLGLQGDGNHTLEEYIEVASLAERARLMAALLQALE